MNGKELKRLRLEKGETQLEAATASGVVPNVVYSIENGKTKDPRVSTVKKLADHFGVTVDEILSEE